MKVKVLRHKSRPYTHPTIQNKTKQSKKKKKKTTKISQKPQQSNAYNIPNHLKATNNLSSHPEKDEPFSRPYGRPDDHPQKAGYTLHQRP
jgi:hypothetical protein